MKSFPYAPPHSLKNSNVSLKVKTSKEKIEVCSLAHITLGEEGHAGALGWGP